MIDSEARAAEERDRCQSTTGVAPRGEPRARHAHGLMVAIPVDVLPDKGELVRIGKRQRPPQHRRGQSKRGRRHRDRDGERQADRGGKPRPPARIPHRPPHIVDQRPDMAPPFTGRDHVDPLASSPHLQRHAHGVDYFVRDIQPARTAAAALLGSRRQIVNGLNPFAAEPIANRWRQQHAKPCATSETAWPWLNVCRATTAACRAPIRRRARAAQPRGGSSFAPAA